jgi:NADH-ubiquinone oxidoreductase chain 2
MSPPAFNRVAIIVLLYSSVLAWNTFFIEPIGVGLGIYGGLFHISLLSQAFDTFILACGSMILLLGSGSIPVVSTMSAGYDPLSEINTQDT